MAADVDALREWAAGVATVLAVAVAGWWKGRLVVRDDQRTDAGRQRAHDGQSKLIVQLTAQVDRLDATVRELSTKLDEEIGRRWAAEAKAAEQAIRIAVLEREIAELRGEPT